MSALRPTIRSLIDEPLLRRLREQAPAIRLEHIIVELKQLQGKAGDVPTFTRKAILRLQDETRLKLNLVTKEDLQRENSPIPLSAFKNAQVKFNRR